MEARDGLGKMTMFRKRSAMWSMDKGTRWKFTSQKRCSEPLPYGHGSERLGNSTFMSPTPSPLVPFRGAILFFAVFTLSAANLKLYTTDGEYQLVREYRVEGDRVKFYSVERSEWEEVP